MACGAIALLVDRVVFSGSDSTPAQAHAQEDRPDRRSTKPHQIPSAAAAKLAAAKASTVLASIPELPFPRNLPAFDSSGSFRDIFSPPGSDDQGRRRPGSGSRPDKAALSAAQFSTKHRLDAVLIRDELKIAIVDASPLRDGDSLDGCQLVRISGTSVEFSCGGGPAVLNLSNPLEKSRESQVIERGKP